MCRLEEVEARIKHELGAATRFMAVLKPESCFWRRKRYKKMRSRGGSHRLGAQVAAAELLPLRILAIPASRRGIGHS